MKKKNNNPPNNNTHYNYDNYLYTIQSKYNPT